MHVWIIGAGGLLGGALVHEFPGAFTGRSIRWSNKDQSVDDLKEDLKLFRIHVKQDPQPWCILWAAGHATVSSDTKTCEGELDVFARFIEELQEDPPDGQGTFFLTSSAGGVFAGSQGAPFTVYSQVCPVSAYGRLKLAQEMKAQELSGIRCVVGRISNLYGPGQDLSKLQGLVSRLVKAGLDKETINIFVPLDTIRDFIYVQDAASAIASVIKQPSPPQLIIIASGEPKSLGTVIAQVQDVLRIKIPIAFGAHASGSSQASDLRMTPTLPIQQLTPFPAGVKAVISDLMDRLQNR